MRDDDWRARYAAGSTCREIAAEDGVDWTTVRRVIDEPRRRGTRPKLTVADVVSAVIDAGGVAVAAEKLGVSPTAVRRGLWRAGLANDPKGVGRPDMRWPQLAPQHWDLRARMVERDAIVRARAAEGVAASVIAAETGMDEPVVAGILSTSR